MSNIDFTCPHCQSQMNFPSAAVGQQGKCSGCQQNVTIQPDLPPPLPDPAAKKNISIYAAVCALDGSEFISARASAPLEDSLRVGTLLADELIAKGAGRALEEADERRKTAAH